MARNDDIFINLLTRICRNLAKFLSNLKIKVEQRIFVRQSIFTRYLLCLNIQNLFFKIRLVLRQIKAWVNSHFPVKMRGVVDNMNRLS